MQKINLFTEEFRPKKIILPLEHIIALCCLTIVLLILSSFVLSSILKDGKDELAAKQTKAAGLVEQANKLEKEVNLRRLDQSLVNANERLKEKMQAREEMITILESLVVEGDDGFSNLMLALARQTTDDLWLEQINISAAGKNIALQGVTARADAVPTYLQKLRDEQGFLGRTFTLFELSQDEQKSQEMRFTLRSQIVEEQAIVFSAGAVDGNSNRTKQKTGLPDATKLSAPDYMKRQQQILRGAEQ